MPSVSYASSGNYSPLSLSYTLFHAHGCLPQMLKEISISLCPCCHYPFIILSRSPSTFFLPATRFSLPAEKFRRSRGEEAEASLGCVLRYAGKKKCGVPDGFPRDA
jgi:hypothetical protein